MAGKRSTVCRETETETETGLMSLTWKRATDTLLLAGAWRLPGPPQTSVAFRNSPVARAAAVSCAGPLTEVGCAGKRAVRWLAQLAPPASKQATAATAHSRPCDRGSDSKMRHTQPQTRFLYTFKKNLRPLFGQNFQAFGQMP